MYSSHLYKCTILLIFCAYKLNASQDFCDKDSFCGEPQHNILKPRYIFYDVNFPEGFNLRRDVYMRLAVFMSSMREKGYNWHLVLPPWHHLYHWSSNDIGEQNFLPWSTFFDVDSMKRFAPVMELNDFLHEVGKGVQIEEIYVLQHYKDAFSQEEWDWSDRWTLSDCDNNIICKGNNCRMLSYIFDKNIYHGWFWGYRNMTTSSVKCVSFQGPASLLEQIIKNNSFSSIMIDHAEVVVHDTFGDNLYWKCRRSMRFSEHLVNEASNFRSLHLSSNDTSDATLRPKSWEDERGGRKAIGGPYICVHLRRRDFLYGRQKQVPSIEYAARQITNVLDSLNIQTVFIATDSSQEEIEELRENIEPAKLMQYRPDIGTKTKIKDGGVAIVDQIICSNARHFIGTHESTFTFRIQEEREIIGFPEETTFNVFCANKKKCFKTSRWKIVY